MSFIGQLLVELGINTAAFKEGLDKATYQAQQFAKQAAGSFDALKESVGHIGESFAQLDPAIGGAIQGITDAIGPLTASLGTVGGATAGLAAALVGAGIGAIGIAAHFSETAARLGELSQATGIAVPQLSLLGDIASTKGIGIDQMGKALERMSKNALQAAQAGPNASNAFKDLGIAVTNTDGTLRNAQDIFNDISVKFAAMPDGPLKTAEAMKIFGRAGAELIPLLNQGGEKLGELEAHFTALNAVVSGPTAAAAEQFKENTTLVGAAFTGIENQITADLLPAMNELAKEFISAFEGGQDNIKGMIEAVADVAKTLLNLGQVLGLLGKLIVDAVGAGIEAFQQLGEVIKLVSGAIVNAGRGDFKGAWAGLQEAGVGTFNRIKDNAKLAIADIESSVKNMQNVWSAAAPTPKASGGPQPSPQGGANTSFVDKQVASLAEQVAKERELADAVGKATESQIDANAAAEYAASIQKLVDEATEKGIQNTTAFKRALDAAKDSLQASSQFLAVYKAIISDQTALDSFNKKLDEQAAALRGDADAGSVVQRAQEKNNQALQPLIQNLAQLGAKYQEMRVAYGDADRDVKTIAADFERQSKAVAEAEAATAKLNAAIAANAGAKDVAIEEAKVKALHNTVAALQEYGEAQAKINVAVADFATKTGASAAMQQKMIDALKQVNAEEQQIAAQKLATPGSSEQAQNLKIQIDYLQQQIQTYQSLGKSTQGYVQALNQVNAEYQTLQAQTGNWQQGAIAGFANFSKSAQSAGQVMSSTVLAGLNGITDAFASMVTGAKFSWQNLINSMEQMLIKSAIQTLISKLLQSLNLGGASGGGGGAGLLSGLFGGGHADGGDVTPGKTYLVGERGPELLQIGAAGGSIVPNGQFGQGGGGGTSVTVVQNIKTPDVNSFKSSSAQLHAQAYQQASTKFSRMNT